MSKFLRNPKGSKDWLPEEVIKQDFVKNKLFNVFQLWGYKPIQTPILINFDTITQGSSKLSEIAFKLIGQQGDILALRADLTTPIARVTAERLKEATLPLRFCYIGKVFRYHARKTTNECELYQIGMELIGPKEGIADLECLKVLTRSLDKLGIKKYLVLFNHTLLWDELFRSFGTVAYELYNALSQKDLVLFDSILRKSKLSRIDKEFWRELINIRGNKEILKKIYLLCKKVKKIKLKNVLSYLKTIFNVLESNVEVDLSLTSDLDYYTGIYFEVITPNLGRSIGSGGRYDGLIGKFGFNVPAIGYSFCLEDLILCLQSQGVSFPAIKQPKVVKKNKNLKKTFMAIEKLQSKNKCTTIKL